MLVGQSLLHSLCQRTSWGETANHLESASFCMTDRDVDTKTIPIHWHHKPCTFFSDPLLIFWGQLVVQEGVSLL